VGSPGGEKVGDGRNMVIHSAEIRRPRELARAKAHLTTVLDRKCPKKSAGVRVALTLLGAN